MIQDCKDRRKRTSVTPMKKVEKKSNWFERFLQTLLFYLIPVGYIIFALSFFTYYLLIFKP